MRFVHIHSMPAGEITAEFRRDDSSLARTDVMVRNSTQAAPADIAAALRQLADKILELA